MRSAASIASSPAWFEMIESLESRIIVPVSSSNCSSAWSSVQYTQRSLICNVLGICQRVTSPTSTLELNPLNHEKITIGFPLEFVPEYASWKRLYCADRELTCANIKVLRSRS